MPRGSQRDCVCGHAREPHEHYRRGSDCSLCPPGGCRRFRPRGGRLRWLRLLVANPAPRGRSRR